MPTSIKNITIPLVMVASIVASAFGMAWWARGVLAEMNADMRAEVTTFRTTVTDEIETIGDDVREQFQAMNYELQTISATLDRMDSSHVDVGDLKLWIEKLRAAAHETHEVPPWEGH